MWWWLPFGRVAEIEASDLDNKLKEEEEIQLLDLRTQWEFKRAHIQGARWIPIHTFKKNWPSLALDPDKPIIAICKSAHRSIPAVRLLQQAGYDAQQLAGGMDAWRRAGLPVVQE